VAARERGLLPLSTFHFMATRMEGIYTEQVEDYYRRGAYGNRASKRQTTYAPAWFVGFFTSDLFDMVKRWAQKYPEPEAARDDLMNALGAVAKRMNEDEEYQAILTSAYALGGAHGVKKFIKIVLWEQREQEAG
jgi:hypothetical protein